MQDDFFTSPLPDRSNVSSLRNVDADTGDSLGTDLLRLLELSPPSSTFGTKLCRNISFPNRPRLSVPPSDFTGHPPPPPPRGKSGNRRAGGRAESGRADTRCPELGAVVRHSAPSFLEEQRPHGLVAIDPLLHSAMFETRALSTQHRIPISIRPAPPNERAPQLLSRAGVQGVLREKIEPNVSSEHSLR